MLYSLPCVLAISCTYLNLKVWFQKCSKMCNCCDISCNCCYNRISIYLSLLLSCCIHSSDCCQKVSLCLAQQQVTFLQKARWFCSVMDGECLIVIKLSWQNTHDNYKCSLQKVNDKGTKLNCWKF